MRHAPHAVALSENTEHTPFLAPVPSSAYSVLQVDLSAYAHNYRYLCQAAPDALCAAVLKADAYGVGAEEIATHLYQQGCRHFFVAYVDEGVRLRQCFTQGAVAALGVHIYVLNGLLPGLEEAFLEFNLIPVLTDLDQVSRWSRYCQQQNRPLPAALHIDTGMVRTGLTAQDVDILSENPALHTGYDLHLILSQMVYSHHENPTYNRQQRARFDDARSRLPAAPASLAKSGPVFLGKEYHYQMIRPGIALHGIHPIPSQDPTVLRPGLTLWSRVYQVQDVPAGQSIGYNQTYTTHTTAKVATLTMGYADGYPWSLANKGYVLFGGYTAPILGRVSMDLITVDVTDIPGHLVHPGAWAQLLGGALTVEKLAQDAGTVPYEFLLGLGKRFHRFYVESPCS